MRDLDRNAERNTPDVTSEYPKLQKQKINKQNAGVEISQKRGYIWHKCNFGMVDL